jgi:hypothetical protein
MSLQNRVTPFGDIIADPAKGLFMGNRGRFHDGETRTLTKRRWMTRAWLVCLCEFNGRRRTVMGPNTYTELFFLDEATAFAAGHRPCFECRRADFLAFRAAWGGGRAAEMDDTLHAERLDGVVKRLHPLDGEAGELPDGAMIADGDAAYLIHEGRAWRWSPGGYVGVEAPRAAMMLTPPSIVAALRRGYRVAIHPSAA